MTSSDHNEHNYDVGYGRPPLQHRFRKGHSGNPKGKIQGQRTLKTELAEELQARITVTENGKTRKLSKLSVIVKRVVSDGIDKLTAIGRKWSSIGHRHVDAVAAELSG